MSPVRDQLVGKGFFERHDRNRRRLKLVAAVDWEGDRFEHDGVKPRWSRVISTSSVGDGTAQRSFDSEFTSSAWRDDFDPVRTSRNWASMEAIENHVADTRIGGRSAAEPSGDPVSRRACREWFFAQSGQRACSRSVPLFSFCSGASRESESGRLLARPGPIRSISAA